MSIVGIVSVVIGYLLGSIPSGYIAVRLAKGKDIRHSGSGNVGSVNAFREAGAVAGIAVLLADVGKGVASEIQWREGLSPRPRRSSRPAALGTAHLAGRSRTRNISYPLYHPISVFGLRFPAHIHLVIGKIRTSPRLFPAFVTAHSAEIPADGDKRLEKGRV